MWAQGTPPAAPGGSTATAGVAGGGLPADGGQENCPPPALGLNEKNIADFDRFSMVFEDGRKMDIPRGAFQWRARGPLRVKATDQLSGEPTKEIRTQDRRILYI